MVPGLDRLQTPDDGLRMLRRVYEPGVAVKETRPGGWPWGLVSPGRFATGAVRDGTRLLGHADIGKASR